MISSSSLVVCLRATPVGSLHEAYALCSVAGDLKINEVVDLPNWAVSMTLPRGIFA